MFRASSCLSRFGKSISLPSEQNQYDGMRIDVDMLVEEEEIEEGGLGSSTPASSSTPQLLPCPTSVIWSRLRATWSRQLLSQLTVHIPIQLQDLLAHTGRRPHTTSAQSSIMAPSSTLVNKIKVQLKLSISRLRMVQQKDTAVAKQSRRSMAQLLEQGKDESARIRVENIIRSDMNTELLEIIELYCELLSARAGLLEAKECDPGLEEAVKSIMYAAPRIEGVKELSTVRQLLAEKYGKEFTLEAVENSDGKVSQRVLDRTKVEPPAKELVEAYLSAIADAYGIDWPPGTFARRQAEAQGEDDDEDDDEGGSKERPLEAPLGAEDLTKATPPRDMGPKSPVSVMPPSPSTDNIRPKISGAPDLKPPKKMQDASKKAGGGNQGGPGGKIPDVDELTKRFAQLKR
jgi:vacuolar protein sorting-associated protein IST1